jgi:iron(III) transport system permease protein
MAVANDNAIERPQSRMTFRATGLGNGRVAIVLVGAVALAIVVVLLAVVGQMAFQEREIDGSTFYTLRNFVELYSDQHAYQALRNTAIFALIAVLVSLCFAVPIAWLAERTDLPGRRFIFPMLTFTLLVPSFFTAMGWQVLLNGRVGILNQWAVGFLPISEYLVKIDTIYGMGWIEGLSLIALTYVIVAGSIRSMDPSLEESAQVHGLPFWRRMRRVTIPLAWPGILGAGLYVVAVGMSAFDVPAIIGLTGGIFTFSTYVYSLAMPEDGTPQYGVVAASSGIMFLFAILVTWWYLRVISKAHRYAVVTGKNYRPQLVALGKWRFAAWAFILLTVSLIFILPLLVLIWVALTPVLMMPSAAALARVSLSNFYGIPWRNFWLASYNSAILALVVPTLTVISGLAISWVVIRSRLKIAGAFDMLAFLPHVVPNIIFAVGAMLLTLFWLPSFLSVYGTIYIIIPVYIIIRISFATRIYNSSLLQIHKELDECGYVFGLGPLKIFRRILLPILGPVLVYTWLWMALMTLRELTVAAFLVTSNNLTLPVYIWGIWGSGDMSKSAAVSLILIVAMMPLVALYLFVSRRWSGGRG